MMLSKFRRKFLPPLFLCAFAALQLSGCTAILLTGAAVGGIMVAQERSPGDALDDTAIHGKISAAMLQKDEALFRRVDVDVVEGPGPHDRFGAEDRPPHRCGADRLAGRRGHRSAE